MEVGAPISPDGVASSQIVGASAFVIFPLHYTIQKMACKNTTDNIFTVREMQKNFRVKGKKLYIDFVDMGKAFDRVPREVIRWAMRKLEAEEWLVSAVMSVYTGAKTVVRTVYGNSNGFEVKLLCTKVQH